MISCINVCALQSSLKIATAFKNVINEIFNMYRNEKVLNNMVLSASFYVIKKFVRFISRNEQDILKCLKNRCLKSSIRIYRNFYDFIKFIKMFLSMKVNRNFYDCIVLYSKAQKSKTEFEEIIENFEKSFNGFIKKDFI